MDDAVVKFRRAAARENRGRHGLHRRYSPGVQQQAVNYCRMRQRGGDGFRAVAAALGVADWSLRRWMKASKKQVCFSSGPSGLARAGASYPEHRHSSDRRRPTRRGPRYGGGSAAAGAVAMRWPGRRVAVYAYARPTDMRKGFDGICALVTEGLQRDPLFCGGARSVADLAVRAAVSGSRENRWPRSATYS
jgi:hypothetical protein